MTEITKNEFFEKSIEKVWFKYLRYDELVLAFDVVNKYFFVCIYD